MSTIPVTRVHDHGATPDDISAGRAAFLQLAPGLASLPVFAVLAWLLADRGIPNIFALVVTIVLVEVPISWWIMLRHVRGETGRFSFRDAFPWHRPVPWWQYLLIGLPLVFFSMFMIVGVGPRVEAVIVDAAFDWMPGWFVMRPDPGVFTTLSQPLLLTLWILMFFGLVLAGGCTQELYSRGFLLPRTRHLGLRAPAWNALLFAVFHLIAPWSWPVFFLMTLPWAYLVWWRRSVKIGLFIHVGMLGLQWLGMTLMLLGIVSAPA